MIYVQVRAIMSEGRGASTANGWHDTDDIAEAVVEELRRFHDTWEAMGEGAAVTYTITVAPDASPRRTRTPKRWPLPVVEDGR